MDVCCDCCVLSGRGRYDGLITRPEESYQLWRVVVCDQETSKTRRLKPTTGLWKIQPQWVVTPGKQTNKLECNSFLHSINKTVPPCLTFATKLTRKQNDFCVYQEDKLGVIKRKKVECLINVNCPVYRPCFSIVQRPHPSNSITICDHRYLPGRRNPKLTQILSASSPCWLLLIPAPLNLSCCAGTFGKMLSPCGPHVI